MSGPSVEQCTAEDIPELANILSASFMHVQPIIDLLFPEHDTTGRQLTLDRLQAWFASSGERTNFLKATIDNKIIGWGIWTYMTTSDATSTDLTTIQDVAAGWPDEKDQRFAKELWACYPVPRRAAVEAAGENGLWALEMCCVHPSHERKGAGSAIVNWGADKASEMGVDAVIEATRIGGPMYRKCGFEVEIERIEFEVDEEYGDRKVPELFFMRKKPAA